MKQEEVGKQVLSVPLTQYNRSTLPRCRKKVPRRRLSATSVELIEDAEERTRILYSFLDEVSRISETRKRGLTNEPTILKEAHVRVVRWLTNSAAERPEDLHILLRKQLLEPEDQSSPESSLSRCSLEPLPSLSPSPSLSSLVKERLPILENAAEDDNNSFPCLSNDRVQCQLESTSEVRDLKTTNPQVILNGNHTLLDKIEQASSSPDRQDIQAMPHSCLSSVSTHISSSSSPSVTSPSQSSCRASPISSPPQSLLASPTSSPTPFSYSSDIPISKEELSNSLIAPQARVMPEFQLTIIDNAEGVYPCLWSFRTEFNEVVTSLSPLTTSPPDTCD